MSINNTKKHSKGKGFLVSALCVAGAVIATFIGAFAFIGAKAKQKRQNCKNKNNPLKK